MLHVGQLGAEPGQAVLGVADARLGVVQVLVLSHGGQQAAAEHVPGTPVLGAVQAVQHGGQGRLRRAARGDGLPHLPALALQLVQPLIQLGEPGAGRSAHLLEQLPLLLQQGVPPDAVDAQAVLFPQHRSDAPVDVLQIPPGLVVLELGRQGLPPLLGQAGLLVAGDGEQQGAQAPLLQLVHVLLFLPEHAAGVHHPLLPLRPLLLEILQLGLQLALPGQGLVQLLQLSVDLVQPLIHVRWLLSKIRRAACSGVSSEVSMCSVCSSRYRGR